MEQKADIVITPVVYSLTDEQTFPIAESINDNNTYEEEHYFGRASCGFCILFGVLFWPLSFIPCFFPCDKRRKPNHNS